MGALASLMDHLFFAKLMQSIILRMLIWILLRDAIKPDSVQFSLVVIRQKENTNWECKAMSRYRPKFFLFFVKEKYWMHFNYGKSVVEDWNNNLES